MSKFSDDDSVYNNYLRCSDFKPQIKFKTTRSRQKDTNKVIPEIVEQREKERQTKKQEKRKLSTKQKNFAIMRTQSRKASGRSQLVNFNEIEHDNNLANELSNELYQQSIFYDDWYY